MVKLNRLAYFFGVSLRSGSNGAEAGRSRWGEDGGTFFIRFPERCATRKGAAGSAAGRSSAAATAGGFRGTLKTPPTPEPAGRVSTGRRPPVSARSPAPGRLIFRDGSGGWLSVVHARPRGSEFLVRTVGHSLVWPVIPDAAPRLGFGVGIALCRAPLVEPCAAPEVPGGLSRPASGWPAATLLRHLSLQPCRLAAAGLENPAYAGVSRRSFYDAGRPAG